MAKLTDQQLEAQIDRAIARQSKINLSCFRFIKINRWQRESDRIPRILVISLQPIAKH